MDAPTLTGLGGVFAAVVVGIWQNRVGHEKLRTELTGVRGELKGEIASLRTELKADIAELRKEIAVINERFQSVYARIDALAARLGSDHDVPAIIKRLNEHDAAIRDLQQAKRG